MRKIVKIVVDDILGPNTPVLEMKSYDSLDEIKSILKQKLGLVENPTEEELDTIIQRKKRKVKGKTVFFRDVIDEMNDLSDLDDLIDAKIVEEPIRVRVRNDDL